jgi:hypothetical protein
MTTPLQNRRAVNRAKFHKDRVEGAPSSLSRLARVLDWLKAEARRLADHEIDDLTEWAFTKATDLNERSTSDDAQ